MKNNQFININDDGIGIDPTVVTKIESLDDEPSNVSKKKGVKPSKNKNTNNKNDLVKKIIFTLVVIILMGAVSYGVYYYLSLGRKTQTVVKLYDKEVYLGNSLSTNILEYGDFSKVDIAKCNINLNEVNIDKTGNYKYTVKCGDVEYKANISVVEKVVLNLATKFVSKNKNDDIKAEEFIETTEDGYTYKLIDDKKYENGLHSVGIKATNAEGKSEVVYAALYVHESNPALYLTCLKETDSKTNYNVSQMDKFAFDDSDNDLDKTVRISQYQYNSEEEFDKAKNNIQKGVIKIENNEGISLIDNNTYTISIVNSVSRSDLEKEFNTTLGGKYRSISNYYRRTLRYSCSI